jgi:NAD dependent epimerase/dehydratase family enzyme
MNKVNIFCFGFGQVAKHFIKKLISQKKPLELNISSRQETCSKKFDGLTYNSYQFENKKIDKEIKKKVEEADYILVSIPPSEGKDIVSKYFKENLKKTNCKWITYLSATSVYGDHAGEWVDENSKTKPTSSTGLDRLNAETSWLKLAKELNLPLQIFRLSGIYSNQNNILKRLALNQIKLVKKNNHFFSRIHVEDIANALFCSLTKFKSNEIYNISDDKPESQEEVAKYGSKLLGIIEPKPLEIDQIESEMLKGFYKDSKKVNNKKMKDFFEYKLKYPTYIEGLNYIFNNKI